MGRDSSIVLNPGSFETTVDASDLLIEGRLPSERHAISGTAFIRNLKDDLLLDGMVFTGQERK